jgi:hypothetical protein
LIRIFFAHYYPLGDKQAYHHSESKNTEDILHGLVPLSRANAMRENHDSHTDPKAENAWHPNSNEKPVVMANKKPECNTRQEACECCYEERIVDFVKHILETRLEHLFRVQIPATGVDQEILFGSSAEFVGEFG